MAKAVVSRSPETKIWGVKSFVTKIAVLPGAVLWYVWCLLVVSKRQDSLSTMVL